MVRFNKQNNHLLFADVWVSLIPERSVVSDLLFMITLQDDAKVAALTHLWSGLSQGYLMMSNEYENLSLAVLWWTGDNKG